MQTIYTSERIKPEISILSAQDIMSITLSAPNPEERLMLDSLGSIEGLMLEKEALALFGVCRRLPNNARILEIGSFQGGINAGDRECDCRDRHRTVLPGSMVEL